MFLPCSKEKEIYWASDVCRMLSQTFLIATQYIIFSHFSCYKRMRKVKFGRLNNLPKIWMCVPLGCFLKAWIDRGGGGRHPQFGGPSFFCAPGHVLCIWTLLAEPWVGCAEFSLWEDAWLHPPRSLWTQDSGRWRNISLIRAPFSLLIEWPRPLLCYGQQWRVPLRNLQWVPRHCRLGQ